MNNQERIAYIELFSGRVVFCGKRELEKLKDALTKQKKFVVVGSKLIAVSTISFVETDILEVNNRWNSLYNQQLKIDM